MLVLVLFKNIEHFLRKRAKHVKENAIFGHKNGGFWTVFKPKKLYYCQLGAKTCLKVVLDLVSCNYAAVGPNFFSFHMKNDVFHHVWNIFH